MKIRIEDWDHPDDGLNLDDLEFSEKINKKKTKKTSEIPVTLDKYKKRNRNASTDETRNISG